MDDRTYGTRRSPCRIPAVHLNEIAHLEAWKELCSVNGWPGVHTRDIEHFEWAPSRCSSRAARMRPPEFRGRASLRSAGQRRMPCALVPRRTRSA